ncbi:MAG: dihydroxy-acid dehydratase, partial [Coriobacteriia bacterium]|nr:dihydroxy-acid dehydratase [Coriobacteriia bacterium]
IDIDAGSLTLNVDDETMQRRRAASAPRGPRVTTGVLGRYARLVTSADRGAVLS